VQPLLSLFHQGLDVVSPGEVAGDVGAQKPEGCDSLHTVSLYEEAVWSCLYFLKCMISLFY